MSEQSSLERAFEVMANQYRQCRLRRGAIEQVAWIPRKFARVGQYIRICDVDGWRVVGCGTIMPREYVELHRNDYRNAFASIV